MVMGIAEKYGVMICILCEGKSSSRGPLDLRAKARFGWGIPIMCEFCAWPPKRSSSSISMRVSAVEAKKSPKETEVQSGGGGGKHNCKWCLTSNDKQMARLSDSPS